MVGYLLTHLYMSVSSSWIKIFLW